MKHLLMTSPPTTRWMSSNTYVSGKGDKVGPGAADGEVVVELLLEHGLALLQKTHSHSMRRGGGASTEKSVRRRRLTLMSKTRMK